MEKIRHSPGTALEAMMPLLEEPVYEGMTRLQTSRDTPIYDSTNTANALKHGPDIKYIALHSELLQRFIRNWVKRWDMTLEHHCKGCFGAEGQDGDWKE